MYDPAEAPAPHAARAATWRRYLRVFGPRLTIKLETGLFKWMFPYHCLSVIGIFRPRR